MVTVIYKTGPLR